MKEQEFENIVAKYPEIIEDGLVLIGRQRNVGGKYLDLLFEDKFGQKLIVELKRGTINRNHVAQLMDYEGYLLKKEDPTLRVMLVGNRVPDNLRRSLDHHGFEWKEIAMSFLKKFLKEKDDKELLQSIKTQKTSDNSVESKKANLPDRKSVGISVERSVFWNALISKLKDKISLNFRTPSKPHVIYASAGKTGMKWSITVKEIESWVELEIMLPGEKIKSHRIFSQLLTYRNEIESKYGSPLRWDKIDTRKSCRIQTTPREKYGVTDENNLDELQNILINKMKTMYEAFGPYVARL